MVSSAIVKQALFAGFSDNGRMSKNPRPEAYTSLQAGIGRRIAWARELVALSQSELARLIGITPSMISLIESGDRAPNIFYVIEIANRLRVSTDYILRGLLTAKTDEEMALRLAASHPELVLRMKRTGEDTDTAPVGDTPQRPRTQALLSLNS